MKTEFGIPNGKKEDKLKEIIDGLETLIEKSKNEEISYEVFHKLVETYAEVFRIYVFENKSKKRRENYGNHGI